jgi:hypothetical protein
MKQKLILVIVVLVSISAKAQYKKASFLQRSGRVYELGTGIQVYGSGLGASPLFTFSYGKDKGANRVFHWWDLELVAPSKFKYNTTGRNSSSVPVPITVSGKTASLIYWRYNWAYYLGDNSSEDAKILPFLKLGLTLTISEFGNRTYAYTVTPSNISNPEKTPGSKISGGADFGAGIIYKFSEKIDFKAVAGFRGIIESAATEYSRFPVIKNHPFLNVGVRFLMKGDD